MTFKILALLLFIIALSAACSRGGEQEEVSLDVTKKAIEINADEVRLDDSQEALKNVASPISAAMSSGVKKLAPDNSEIYVMIDRYGNKTETRNFINNQRLSLLVLRTSADGKKECFLYGQNGERKAVPAEMFDRALSAPASILANAAQMDGARHQIETQTFTVQNKTPVMPMKNLPTTMLSAATPTEEIQEEQTVEETPAPAATPQTAEIPRVEQLPVPKRRANEKINVAKQDKED